jgi:hypothetical protein
MKSFVRESGVLSAAIQTLQIYGFICIRNNSGAARTGTGRLVRFGSPGSADIIACSPAGRFVAVECKRPGGQLTGPQRDWLEKITRSGGEAIVAESVNSLKEQLIMRGLIAKGNSG